MKKWNAERKLAEPQAFARKTTLKAHLNENNYGYSWTDATFLDHCQGNETLYFFSRFQSHPDEEGVEELLPEDCMAPYFDIDINKSQGIGTSDNAKKAIQFLENYFPGLYSENDRRAFPLIYNDGYELAEFKAIIKKLQTTFNDLLTRHCGIEKFEIKGMPANIYKEDGRWHVGKYGTLGKLPTQLLERLDEFYGQPIIRVSELEMLLAQMPTPEGKAAKAGGGSTTDIILNEEQLALVPDGLAEYKNLSYYCMAMRKDDPAGRRKITALDFQIAFVVLSACNLKPNDNGQLPSNRIKVIWTYLFENGFVPRAFDGSRWKVIRDTMEDCGLLDMVDNTYYFCKDGSSKGKAMEWSLKSEYSFDFQQQLSIYCGTLSEYVAYRSRPLLVFAPAFDLVEASKAIDTLFLNKEMEGLAWFCSSTGLVEAG